MPKRVRLRTLTDEEHESVYSLAASRTTASTSSSWWVLALSEAT